MANKPNARKVLTVGDRIKEMFKTCNQFSKKKLTEEQEALLAGAIGFHMEDYKDQELLKEIQKINAWLEGQIT